MFLNKIYKKLEKFINFLRTLIIKKDKINEIIWYKKSIFLLFCYKKLN